MFGCRLRWLAWCSALVLAAAGNVKIQSAVDVSGWARQARCDPDLVLPVMLSLKNRNMQQLGDEVRAVSSPSSPRYGQHLKLAEIEAMTGPGKAAQESVRSWLVAAGIEASASRWGDRFEFRARVRQIEEAFSTTVHHFSDGTTSVPQAGDLHVPDDVATSIAAVFGLHGVPLRRPRVAVDGLFPAKVTPDLLLRTYNITGAPEVRRGSKNKRAVAEFQGEYTKQDDLTSFFKQYVPSAKEGDDIYTCVGDRCEPENEQEHIGVEAMLDIEYIMGPAPGIKSEVWFYKGMSFCTDMKNWTAAILDHDDPPLVFSISYGVQGNITLDQRQGCSMQLLANIEDDFAKIAARGVSLIFSSGDDGSGGTFLLRAKLWPSWPASSAYVTAVGATQFISGSAGPEQAVRRFGSGGGFDWTVPLQPWQEDAVSGYLARKDAGLPHDGDYNRAGRATPDVAALGLGYQVVVNKQTQSVGGTSASAPLFASLVSLLNEARLQQGKSALGFLNPLIYEMGKASRGFRDVTVGNNRKTGDDTPTREGYSCTEGWDAVTGFGTPNFQDMLKYVQDLPSGFRSEIIV